MCGTENKLKKVNFIIFGNMTMTKMDMTIAQGQHYDTKIFFTILKINFLCRTTIIWQVLTKI